MLILHININKDGRKNSVLDAVSVALLLGKLSPYPQRYPHPLAYPLRLMTLSPPNCS